MTLRTDGIWVCDDREIAIVQDLSEHIISQGYMPVVEDANNFTFPYGYQKDKKALHCRFVDSVFQPQPSAWTDKDALIVTDNHPLRPVAGRVVSALPEFWHIWHFNPVYEDCVSSGYNCFMNRVRGDRNEVFYELIRRRILNKGRVSYNVTVEELNTQYESAELYMYKAQHYIAQKIVPYNWVDVYGSLEQVIMQSNVSLILETYCSNDHVVFSEKLFRALQLPRPWLLFCSPQSIALLRRYGFDVLDEYVDHSYDDVVLQCKRLELILDQLETFITMEYTSMDYQRFNKAAKHNQDLLSQYKLSWPLKYAEIKQRIKIA